VSIALGKAYSRECVAPDSNPPAIPFWILRAPDNVKQISGINSSHISSNERVGFHVLISFIFFFLFFFLLFFSSSFFSPIHYSSSFIFTKGCRLKF
jgi:hypothetical protein